MGHSLDRFQELRMKGKNDKVGLCSFYVILRNCSLNPPALKTVYVQSPGFKVSNLSQPCVHWWVFVGVKNWTRSCEDAITPLTHRYHKRHLMTESFWRDKLLLTFSEESELLFLLNIITKRWTVRKRGGVEELPQRKSCANLCLNTILVLCCGGSSPAVKVGSYMSVIPEDRAVARFSRTPAP